MECPEPPKAPDESFRLRIRATVRKYRSDEEMYADADPLEVIEGPWETITALGNTLVYGGASAIFDLLIGAGNVTAFNNANAYLGVGDSSTATTSTMTDLQGSSKTRVGMDTSYPSHTDGTTSSNDSVDFKMSAAAGTATHDWNEWGLFNASSGGRMLNRKVKAFGTKGAGDAWTLTVTLSAS